MDDFPLLQNDILLSTYLRVIRPHHCIPLEAHEKEARLRGARGHRNNLRCGAWVHLVMCDREDISWRCDMRAPILREDAC